MNDLDAIKEAEAVAALRAAVAGLNEDEQLLLDTIEGETGLFELIDALLLRRTEATAYAQGLDGAIRELQDRKERLKDRADRIKAMIEQALTIAGLSKLERPGATLSLSARPASLHVTEESEIPARYWKPSEPVLDRKALIEDLRARAKALASLPEDAVARAAAAAALPPEIPGATLSNAAPTLTIRIK